MRKSIISKVINNPFQIFCYLARKGWFKWLDDKIFLRFYYRGATGYKLNYENPRNFNEKLQCLKISKINLKFSMYADKYEVREIVAKKIGKSILVDLYGVWNDPNDINFDKLPNEFVLKCTHDSGTVVTCYNKNNLNIEETIEYLQKKMDINYYHYGREDVYQNIVPRIICEELLVDKDTNELRDYKFFVFGGQVKMIQVDVDRFNNHRRNMYSPTWDLLDMSVEYPRDPNTIIPKPTLLNKMIEISETLASNMIFARVDLYLANEKIYFGEVTFYPGSGQETISPYKCNVEMGKAIQL